MKQNKNVKAAKAKTTKKTAKPLNAVKAKTVKKVAETPVVAKHNSFIEAIIKYWRGYFDFKGVASRKNYWYAVLFVFLLNMFFNIIGVSFLVVLLSAILFIPSRAVAFRRYHDAGLSGFIYLIPCLTFFLWASIRSEMWLFAMKLEVAPVDLRVYSILFLIWALFHFTIVLKKSKLTDNRYRK